MINFLQRLKIMYNSRRLFHNGCEMMSGRKKMFFKYVSFNVAGMLGLSFYILIDTVFIAQALGNEGLAALNFAIPIYGITHASGMMIGIGGAIKYNVYKTQGQQDKANQVFTATALLGVLFSLVYITAGLFFYEDVARLLGARPGSSTFSMTADYLRVILVFSPLYLTNNILVAFIRNDGVPSLAMGGMITSSMSNIGFDYLLLFVFPLGMFGAALATTFSALLAFIYLLMFFVLKKNTVRFGRVKQFYLLWGTVLLLGIPTFLVDFSYSLVMSLFNRLLDSLQGTVAVASFGIIANLSLLSIAMFIGVSQGVQPLLTRAYSKGDTVTLKKNLALAIFVLLGLSTVIYSLFYMFGDPIVRLFNRDNDPVLQNLAVTGIRIYFIGLFFAGFNILYSAFFAAIERPRLGLIIVLLRGVFIIIPTAILFRHIIGINGVWFSFVVAEFVTLLVAFIIFKQKVESSLVTRTPLAYNYHIASKNE